MSDHDLQEAASPEGEESKGHTHRRLAPPIWVWVVAGIAIAVIAVVQGADAFRDHAISNVATLIAAFVALMTALVWFSFLSGYSRRMRRSVLAGTLAVIAAICALFEIVSVSGELVPKVVPRFTVEIDWAKGRVLPSIALRWRRKPDELLGELKPSQDLAQIDVLATTDHDFPQFLGPDRNLSIRNVELARDWNQHPPQLVWRHEIGAGWSGFAVVGEYAVTMEQRGDLEMVTCYGRLDGRLMWAHSIQTRFDTILAGVGPRATPTIDQGLVYTLGAKGRLLCLDGASGRVRWDKDLWNEFGVTQDDEETQIPYGRANSPLMLSDLVVVPAGGPIDGSWVSLVAYDKKTGDPVWEGGSRQISYSSPVLTKLGGVEQILIVNQDYVSGHDPQTGAVLWEHDWPGKSATNANVSQAVPVPPDRVFLSKGYSRGAMLLQLTLKENDTFDAKPLWDNARVMRTKFTNVVIRDDHAYGLSDGILECIDLETGRRTWKAGRYGHGQILLVGELLLVSAESGEVFLVEATPERRNRVLGSFQAVEGKTWNNLALSGPYLLVRNAGQAACYKLPLAEATESSPPESAAADAE